ncbi:MAG: cold-inducible RNA-binding protein, partial [Cognaticolwellia sp.]
MGKKLFVGGLPWAADDRDLTAAFSAIGTVIEARVITDRETGKSRGFGFVTMETDEQAAECVAKMDGADIKGRPARVREAEERSGGGRGGDRGGGG